MASLSLISPNRHSLTLNGITFSQLSITPFMTLTLTWPVSLSLISAPGLSTSATTLERIHKKGPYAGPLTGAVEWSPQRLITNWR